MSARECIGDEASIALNINEIEKHARNNVMYKADVLWLISELRKNMSELREYKTAVDGIAQRIGLLEECTK